MLGFAWVNSQWLFCLVIVGLWTRNDSADTDKVTSMTEIPTRLTGGSAGHPIEVERKDEHFAEFHTCSHDRECGRGLYCRAPRQFSSHCSPCRRRWRPCHRDAMCCPSNYCNNYVCSPLSQSVLYARIPLVDKHIPLAAKGPGRRDRTRTHTKSLKGVNSLLSGHAGDPCLRSADCSPGHCCARHLWTRVCKPEQRPGEACTRVQTRKGSHRLELFQRCPCALGLTCREESPLSAANASNSRATDPAKGRPSNAKGRARLYTCQQ